MTAPRCHGPSFTRRRIDRPGPGDAVERSVGAVGREPPALAEYTHHHGDRRRHASRLRPVRGIDGTVSMTRLRQHAKGRRSGVGSGRGAGRLHALEPEPVLALALFEGERDRASLVGEPGITRVRSALTRLVVRRISRASRRTRASIVARRIATVSASSNRWATSSSAGPEAATARSRASDGGPGRAARRPGRRRP